ncbi:hypothetical protein N9Y67_01765 [Pseudomonadota bacterium]|nr:hypothetical protein [Pseudomonadota bacterium]
MTSIRKPLMRLLLLLLITLIMSACNEPTGEPAIKAEAIILDNGNISSFKQALLQDYITARNDLLNHFKVFKKENNADGFTQYRNIEWTPNYIEKKHYYQVVLKNNKAYIDKVSLKPLFLKLDNLLIIGVNLKHALRDSDDELLKSTYAQIKADHAVIRKFKK